MELRPLKAGFCHNTPMLREWNLLNSFYSEKELTKVACEILGDELQLIPSEKNAVFCFPDTLATVYHKLLFILTS